MFNIYEQKGQPEEKKEKNEWEEAVKMKFPFDWPFVLAAIQTADAIIDNKPPSQNINWKSIYKACGISSDRIFSSLYSSNQAATIIQCYRGFLRGAEILGKIYYFNNKEAGYYEFDTLLGNLKDAHCNLVSFSFQNDISALIGTEIIKFSEALTHKNCKLTSLNFCSNRIRNAGTQTLAGALKHKNCKLTLLNLKDNEIGVVGIRELAKALCHHNCNLTSLSIENNHFGAAGVIEFADTLTNTNCKLTALNLNYNDIGNLGAEAFAGVLKNQNCKLKSLYFEDNQISEMGAKAFAEVLKDKHCGLITLKLGFNKLGNAGTKALASTWSSPDSKLTSLDLKFNYIGPDGAQALAEALKSENCRLTSLNLRYNHIGPDGAQVLAEALKNENCKLTWLNLRDNSISAQGTLAIAFALKSSHFPRGLQLRLDEDVETTIAQFNEQWHEAQQLYSAITHTNENLQNRSVLPPVVTVHCLLPYLCEIFTDESVPYRFLEEHKSHFINRAKQNFHEQKTHEAKASKQALTNSE